jgi:hypothetical protein
MLQKVELTASFRDDNDHRSLSQLSLAHLEAETWADSKRAKELDVIWRLIVTVGA